MDNLDSLSNEELHVRLLEMGFPNMPVTTTTRKVLIKKLRKHIDGELTKTRRETISAIKHSSDEESDADNRKTNTTDRRTTIGGVPTVAKMMKPPSQPRRSGRITPIGKPEISSAIAPSVPDIIEDTDEDDVIIVEDRRSKSKTPTGFGRRELSSVSIKPVIIHEIDSKINENIHEAYQPRTKTTTQYESNFMRNSSAKQPDIGVTKRYTLGSSSTVTSPYGSGSSYSSVTSPYGIGNTTSSVTSPYGIGSTTSTVTSPYGSGNTAGYGAPMATSTFARPSLTTSYNSYDIRSSYNYGNSNLKRHEEKSSEEEYDEEDEFDNDENITPIETPYLSDFTRRLSALKPEPLLQPKHTQSTTTYRNTVYHRSGINTEKKQTKSILDEFKIFYNALNDSYSINRVIIMLSIILFIIFVFVFMFL